MGAELRVTGQPGVDSARVKGREVQAATEDLTDNLYEYYSLQRLEIVSAKPHPGPLVQSATMVTVLPPKPIYTPKIPKALINSGVLSLAQLKAAVCAGEAHAQMLPAGEGETECCRGFLIGDGSGSARRAGSLVPTWTTRTRRDALSRRGTDSGARSEIGRSGCPK